VKAGWETKRLGEIIQLEYGKPLADSDRNPNGFYPAYGANGIKDRTDKFYKGEPSIIVGRKGSAGEVTLTEEKYWPLDVTFFVEFDRAKYELQYLYFLLLTLNLPSMAKGVKPGINRNDVYDITVTTPDIEEQHRIVTLLDEAFADIATAKANAEKNLQNAEALFQSQLTTLFNRRTKNVTHTTLGQATGGIFTGPFGSLLHKQDYVENGTPLVNPAHISQNGIEPDYRKTVSAETAKRLASYIMRMGDIVIGRRGEMGRCALVTETEDGWLCGTGSFFIKPSPRCDAGYLVHLLRSDQCKQQLENIAGGAVMPNLSNTDLSNFALELPTVDDQKQIVVEIEKAKESVERLKSIYRQKLTALDDLKKSLLHQAFSGQL
jgi:type I restriction enzyme, S subunit